MLYFSGIQPTGRLHIGNYLGAIANWVTLQKSSNIYCIVDYHAITNQLKQDHQSISFPQQIRDDSITLAATLIASGIDYNKSIFFLQSQVPQHTELQWILSCIAPQNWLNKMTQFKDKKHTNSTLGLYTYPVLMAADIILYQATHVPVGDDQKQHVELTRDYVLRLNSLFNTNIPLPEYIESTTPRIMSLRDGNKKMSKSDVNDYSRINLMDSRDIIRDKIKKAKTDSITNIYYDQLNRPELSNLIRIYSAFSSTTIEQITQQYESLNIVQFKSNLAELIISKLNPIALQTQAILNDKQEIIKILKQGSEKATIIADRNLQNIKQSMGLLV